MTMAPFNTTLALEKTNISRRIFKSKLLQTVMNMNANGYQMLNVQFRPFHSLTFCSKNSLNGYHYHQYQYFNLQQRLVSGSLSIRTKEDTANSNPNDGQTGSLVTATEQAAAAAESDDDHGAGDEDEDLEEVQKQNLWEHGPTPAPTFNFAAYANDADIIKNMVKLGVDLSKLELKYGMISFIMKLDFEKDVRPCINFLCENGVSERDLGWYFTRNPYILQEDVQNLEKRLDYLRLKRFSDDNIMRIINVNPFWLSFSITRIDRRLGFFQSYFKLSGSQVRELAVKGPKLITSNIGRVKDITFKVVEEMGFTAEETVSLLLSRPRIWKEKPVNIGRRFDYLHNTIGFAHTEFVRCPGLLLVRENVIKPRIGFLQLLGKAQFDPEQPNYVTYEMLFSGTDSEFATKVAKSSVFEYNEYLKTL